MDKLKLLNNLYSIVNPYTSYSNASAIADTGASGHYLKAEALRDLVSQPVAPIQVKQPNRQILHSTKGFLLALATFPEETREAHILPVLSHSSLVFIGKLCDSGFEASFGQHNMAVTKY